MIVRHITTQWAIKIYLTPNLKCSLLFFKDEVQNIQRRSGVSSEYLYLCIYVFTTVVKPVQRTKINFCITWSIIMIMTMTQRPVSNCQSLQFPNLKVATRIKKPLFQSPGSDHQPHFLLSGTLALRNLEHHQPSSPSST